MELYSPAPSAFLCELRDRKQHACLLTLAAAADFSENCLRNLSQGYKHSQELTHL